MAGDEYSGVVRPPPPQPQLDFVVFIRAPLVSKLRDRGHRWAG